MKIKSPVPRSNQPLATILPMILPLQPCSDAMKFLEAHATCTIEEVFFATFDGAGYQYVTESGRMGSQIGDIVEGVCCDTYRLDKWIKWLAYSVREVLPSLSHPSYDALTDLRWNGANRRIGSPAQRVRYLRALLRGLAEVAA